MKENEFYDMCDVMEQCELTQDKYFPTIEEIKAHNVEENLDKYLPMLIFFSEDPLTKNGIELEEDEYIKYKEMITYVKKLVYQALDND